MDWFHSTIYQFNGPDGHNTFRVMGPGDRSFPPYESEKFQRLITAVDGVQQPHDWYDAPLASGPYMYSNGQTGYLTINDPNDDCRPLILDYTDALNPTITMDCRD